VSDVIVKVDSLSKKYLLSHSNRRSATLREAIGSGAQTAARVVTNLFRNEDLLLPTQEEFWALKDVYFDVRRGDRLGIIGRNGAGKSTLLKVLSRIVEPTKGRISINGRVASLLEVGTGFHPELTGRENIYLNGAILGMRRREIKQKFDEIVEFAGIERFLDTPVKRYSSGMYVRLAFAVAAHLEPEILIVDEVLAVGDAQFQKKCLAKMEGVSNEGRTILFVSHNLAAIRKLCNRGIVLKNGMCEGPLPIEQATALYQSQHEGAYGKILAVPPLEFFDLLINDQPLTTTLELFSDEPISISMHYRSAKCDRDLCISFGLRNVSQDVLAYYSHNHLESVRHKTGSSGMFQATFPAMPLTPGRYAIEMQCWLDGEVLLPEQRIAEFSIAPIPSFKSQTMLTSFPSLIVSEAEWSFKLYANTPQL
jgi:lipopolysaccharide transport system ATP-binding protein